MKANTGLLPEWLKQLMVIGGLLLAIPGVLLTLGFLCTTFILVIENDPETVSVGLMGITVAALTFGAGGAVFWHSAASLQGNGSNLMRLPSGLIIISSFVFFVGLGVIFFQSKVMAGLFLPTSVLVATAVSPLLVVWWFMRQSVNGVTWRRSIVAFAGSAVMSVVVGGLLQMLLLLIVSFLASDPGDAILASLDQIEGSAGSGISFFTTNRGFMLLFVELGIIVPVMATFTKPLVVLPLTGYLSRRELFFIGALAGAGFATLESMVFVILWPHYWAWILVVQAIGGAIHPVGAGILALNWQSIFNKTSNGWTNWTTGFGLSTSMHTLWNIGLLFVLFSRINFYSATVSGSAFFLLAILGLVLFWVGRSIAQRFGPNLPNHATIRACRLVSDQAIAVWAITGAVTIVPVGIILLQFWVR